MIFKKNLIKPPVLRTHHDNSRERHASWLELFYDLMFVAAIARLSDILEHSYSPRAFFAFTGLFIAIWNAWVGQAMYLTRFDSDDLVHRVLSFLQMMALAMLIVNVTHPVGFALAYCAIRLILIAEYFLAGMRIPEVSNLTSHYAAGFLIAVIFWLISTTLSAPWCYALWALAMVIDEITPLTAGHLHLKFPPHLSHLPERFGLFTLIVLGESLIDVVTGIDKNGFCASPMLIGILGICITFALWWVYFDGAKAAHTRRLNTEKHLAKYQVWQYAHLPFAIGVVAFAEGLKHAMELSIGESLSSTFAVILCASLGVALVSLHCIAATHHQHWKIKSFVSVYYFLTGIVFILGIVGHYLSAVTLITLLALLCALHVGLALGAPPVGLDRK